MAEVDSKVAKLIVDALQGNLGGASASPETPTELAGAPVQEAAPPMPSELALDEYEALMVDALQWRIDAVEKSQALFNREKKEISQMKSDLLGRCVRRLGVDINNYNLYIDSASKVARIEKRG